jgi:hypothetical protein
VVWVAIWKPDENATEQQRKAGKGEWVRQPDAMPHSTEAFKKSELIRDEHGYPCSLADILLTLFAKQLHSRKFVEATRPRTYSPAELPCLTCTVCSTFEFILFGTCLLELVIW